jgi:hypothetical protein
MKIGAGDSWPWPANFSNSWAVKTRVCLRAFHRSNWVVVGAALPLVAGLVKVPGPVVVAAVLVGLREREPEMDVGVLAQVVARDLFLHGANLPVLEPEHLQVGHAPVDFAESRLRGDGGPIGAQRRRLVAASLERVAVAELHVWVGRLKPDRSLEGGDRFVQVAGM